MEKRHMVFSFGEDLLVLCVVYLDRIRKRLSNCTKPIIHLLRKIFKVCYILVLNMSRKTGPHHLIWGGELGGRGGGRSRTPYPFLPKKLKL